MELVVVVLTARLRLVGDVVQDDQGTCSGEAFPKGGGASL